MGKSTLAYNLGAALDAVVVDADLAMADLPTERGPDLHDALAGRAAPLEAVRGDPVPVLPCGRSLAGAIGAMFPFVAGSLAEPGIEYGTYALNESPLVLDRFAHETGYCMMVIGQLGAGKSFSTQLQVLRRVMYDRDTMVVLLDSLGEFETVADALDGERTTVGGTRGLNPLELRPAPTGIVNDATDLDPWAEQITWVLTFFETFFATVADNPLGERTQTLRRAVQAAYERQGITRDPATHDNPSPTVRDVIAVLEDVVADPGAFEGVDP